MNDPSPSILKLPARLAKPWAALRKAGYRRIEDLAMIPPKGYADHSRITLIVDAPADAEALVQVEIISRKIIRSGTRRELWVQATDESAAVSVRLMNFARWQHAKLAPGSTVRLFGKVTSETGLLQASASMLHPLIMDASKPLSPYLVPAYPVISKQASELVGQLAAGAARAAAKTQDTLPESFRAKHGLLPLAEALRLLHRPKPDEDQAPGLHTLKFHEWLAYMLSQRAEHQKNSRREGYALPNGSSDIDKFAKLLPFALTSGQRKAIEQISSDIAKPFAMRRLLHGDVGCGKTIVAAYACWICARSGRTAAFMAPTEILASQHSRRLSDLLDKLGIEHDLLTGSTRSAQRRKVQQLLENSPGRCLFGTHALFQAKFAIPHLSLAIIDEQHRFGVKQRHALADKNASAHVLMMSATPIPRSMVLGIYASLDVTRIRDRPHDRAIKTILIHADRYAEVIAALRKDKLQAYWISPLIKASDASGVRAAEEIYRQLSQQASDLAPAMIHGQLTAAEKKQAMSAFEQGTTRLLVATTVVEVGVDAPEADAVIIANADRFGLSQLHQLRGRVGRSSKRGFCALLYDEQITPAALDRLKIIHSSSDGFEIARQDLALRGPGDISGSRQSGIRIYRFADLIADEEILERVPGAADELLTSSPQAAKDHWRFWLGRSSRWQIRFSPASGAKSAGYSPE